MRLAESSGRAAELIAMFEESVIAVRHLQQGERFTVGDSPGAAVALADVGRCSELVRFESGEVVLRAADELGFRVELLDDAGGATEVAWMRELPGEGRVASLPSGRRARYSRGALTILVDESAAPRRHPLPARTDLRVHATTAVVALIFSLALLAISSLPPAGSSLSLDPFLLGNRGAHFQFTPAEQPPSPGMATGGGASAPATAVRRVRSALRPRGATAVTVAGRSAATPKEAREAAEKAAAESPLLAILGMSAGTHGGALFGNSSALGAEADNVFVGLSGEMSDGGGGGGGDGLVGRGGGVGGGGDGTVGLGGLGTIGTCNGCSGSGGGYGRSQGGLGGYTAHGPGVVPGAANVIGDRDRDGVRRVIRSHINELKFCYEKELQHHVGLGGRLVTRFVIAADGRVLSSVTDSSTLGASAVDLCVAQAFRRFEFPKVPSGLAIVSYPLQFHAASGS